MQQPKQLAPIVFVDVETTGLNRESDQVWEFAGIRRDPDGAETPLHLFVDHAWEQCEALPEPFLTDHIRRWSAAVTAGKTTERERAALLIDGLFTPRGEVHIAACIPDFDTAMVEGLLWPWGLTRRPWHYHLIDVENMVRGYLLGEARWLENTEGTMAREHVAHLREAAAPPWHSEEISRLLDIEPPPEGERHTALGDARWCMALYDRMVSG